MTRTATQGAFLAPADPAEYCELAGALGKVCEEQALLLGRRLTDGRFKLAERELHWA